MIRWLLENVGLIVLAFVIAVVVWIAAEWEADPIVEAEFDQPIPVSVENQPPGTHLVEGWQNEVQVRLRAPQSVWDRLSPDDFQAVLDLSPNLNPLEPDEYDVGVQVSIRLEPATLLRVEPDFIRIELEAIEERTVSVSIDVRGDPDLGYQAGDAVYTDTVKVKGPTSQVNEVALAISSVSLRGARATVEENVTLNPVDGDGKRMNGVTVIPEQIQVSVPVRPLPNVKEMSVTWTQLGQPAEGYHITNVGIEPPVVRVRGPVFVLRELPGFLSTEPISIAGRTEDVIERVPLELPPGISMFDPPEPAVRVTIQIDPFIDSVTVTRTLTYRGLRSGLTASASPQVVELILSGPRPLLSSLLPDDVRVVLDLSDLGVGYEGQNEPEVLLPEDITVESIIPSVIQVQIQRVPSRTPTPTPQE